MERLSSSKLITEARRGSKMTQNELARKAGTSQPAIQRYESGKASPSVDTLTRILKAAGFEIEVKLTSVAQSNFTSHRAKKLRAHRREVYDLLDKSGARNPRVFGSVARGEDGPKSDIDLLVDLGNSDDLFPLIRLSRQLSELLDEKVEVTTSKLLKESVLESALKDVIPL